MDFKVIWMDKAAADLEAAVRFVARKNPEAALRLGMKLLEKPVVLESHPRFGRIFRKLNREDVRELIEAPYRIIYRIDDERRAIWIITVWHGARREPDIHLE
jgi:toxin ParE1/3/4